MGGIHRLGKDVWSVILKYLSSGNAKALRLTSKHIEARIREYVFSHFHVVVEKVPKESDIHQYVQRIVLRRWAKFPLDRYGLRITHLIVGPYCVDIVKIPASVVRLEIFSYWKEEFEIPHNVTSFYGSIEWKPRIGNHVSAVYYG